MTSVPVNRTFVDGLLKLTLAVPDGPLLLRSSVALAVRRPLVRSGLTMYAPQNERVRAADPAFIEEARRLFDANDDGTLGLAELLDVEATLSAIRQLAGVKTVDPVFLPAIQRLLEDLREQLLPHAAGETGLPAVQKNAVVEAAFPLLAFVPPDPRYAALDLLRNEVAGLDTRPAPLGDMTSEDEQINQRRLSTLLGIVDGLPPLLRFGRTDELVQTLFKLRDIVGRDQRSWVSGEKAEAIGRAIVQALSLLERVNVPR
jgi:hypothetical protein